MRHRRDHRAIDNGDDTGSSHGTTESQSRDGNMNFPAGTFRGQNDVLQSMGAYSLQTSYSGFGNPVSRPASGVLETALRIPLYHQTPHINTNSAPMRNYPNGDAWSPYSPWLQQNTYSASPWDPVAYPYCQSIEMLVESSLSTSGDMPESYQSLGNQDPATSSFCSEEVQPGHGLVLRAGNNDTLATPSSSSAVSQWRLEARSSQGTQEPLLSVVAAARHFSATNSFENGYTASTTREDTTLPQEPLMLNWDLRRDRYSIIPPRTKTKRRKLTSFEKDRTKALKKAGGACDACRKVKKRCSHKDTLLGLNQTPTSSSSSSANNPRRRRQQISDARAVAIDKHTGSEWRHNSTNASSYQQLTAAGDPSVFTSSENNTPPSDATSIEYTSDINPARRSGTFALYAAGLGLQFNEELLNDGQQVDNSLYSASSMDFASEYPWLSNPSSANNNSSHM